MDASTALILAAHPLLPHIEAAVERARALCPDDRGNGCAVHSATTCPAFDAWVNVGMLTWEISRGGEVIARAVCEQFELSVESFRTPDWKS